MSLFNSYNPAVWVVSPHFIHEVSDADLSHVKVHFKMDDLYELYSQYNLKIQQSLILAIRVSMFKINILWV